MVQTKPNSNKVETQITRTARHMQRKLNLIKLKSSLGAFYSIRPGNASGLFPSSCMGPLLLKTAYMFHRNTKLNISISDRRNILIELHKTIPALTQTNCKQQENYNVCMHMQKWAEQNTAGSSNSISTSIYGLRCKTPQCPHLSNHTTL